SGPRAARREPVHPASPQFMPQSLRFVAGRSRPGSGLPRVRSMSRFAAAIASAFRRYAAWLVAISWKRFILLSVLLLIIAGVASQIPPFTWVISERTVENSKRVVLSRRDVDVKVDEHAVRITPKRKNSPAPEIIIDEHGVVIRRRGDAASGKPSRDIIINEHGVQMRPGASPEMQPTPPAAPPSSESEGTGITEDSKREVTSEPARE